MKQYGFRDRLKYRLDNLMSRGNSGMIRILLSVTIPVVLLIAAAITLLTEAEERSFAASLWDTLAATVNAWMPYSDDGNAGYIVLTALAAVTGLLFTSILIGIISAAIEEKVTGLREGTSVVLESGHIVVLGFTPGEYTLICQLIAAARGEKRCILIAGATPKSEMEAHIAENVEIPKNIRILCRCVDTGDIAALAVCSIPDCKTVVINHDDDVDRLKATLAAHRILEQSGKSDVKIISTASSSAFVVPKTLAAGMNLINVPAGDVIARVIAHSCTETGISAVYSDLFDIGGGNVQFGVYPELAGRTFGEAVRTMEGAVPLGIGTEDGYLLNPPPARVVAPGERLICWTEEGKSVSFKEDRFRDVRFLPAALGQEPKKTVIIGAGTALATIVRELPEQPNVLVAAGLDAEASASFEALAKTRADVTAEVFDGDPADEAALRRLLRDAHHVVILPDGREEPDRADALNILYYLKIAEIKREDRLDFSVTLELRGEKNLQLLGTDRETDFIVAPHLVSMFLAQLSERPEVVGVFKELLSNSGSEIHLRPAAAAGEAASLACAEVRARLLTQGMLLLGYFRAEKAVMNPALSDEIPLDADVRLIVISEK